MVVEAGSAVVLPTATGGPWELELPPSYLPAGVIAGCAIAFLVQALGVWGLLAGLLITYRRGRRRRSENLRSGAEEVAPPGGEPGGR